MNSNTTVSTIDPDNKEGTIKAATPESFQSQPQQQQPQQQPSHKMVSTSETQASVPPPNPHNTNHIRSRSSQQSLKTDASHTTTKVKGRPLARRRVHHTRWLFVLCLTGMAALLGFGSYWLLQNSEDRLAQTEFASLADRALHLSADIAVRKRRGIATLTSMASEMFGNASTWPFIAWPGRFEVVTNHLIETASGDSMSLLPLVEPEELAAFEAFAAPLYPETGTTRVTGLDGTFQRYNETDGRVHWGSPYTTIMPFLYSSRGPILFLANYHSIEERGRELDNVLECSEKRAEGFAEYYNDKEGTNATATEFVPTECSYVTKIVDLASGQGANGFQPASVLTHPIYPANDPSVLVGLITSTIKWHETLTGVFATSVSGVDCVLQTETQVYTYQVTNGEISLKGEGDLHDTDFSKYGQSIALMEPGVYSLSSPTYTLSLYPTQELFEVYATTNPVSATIGAVCIVLLTALCFFVYDFFVREEFSHKDALDKARRQFVRFISHEVRTPLNAVCMGLQLQANESEALLQMMQEQSTTTTANNNNNNNISPTTTSPGSTNQMQNKVKELTSLGNDILSNASGAVDVLNDLLNYDKIESGTLQLELTVINIWELIEQTFMEFQQQAHFNDIQYVLDLSALVDTADQEQPVVSASDLSQDIKNRKVIGDKVRVSQVIRNLISNALKFSKDNGTLTVRPSWKKSSQSVKETEITLHSGEKAMYLPCGDLQIEVQDTGQGMTKEQLKSLFREGVQFNVNELQAGQGSGLGLYIAKGILEQHGGAMAAKSDGIGCGTIFTVDLPLYYVPDPPEQKYKPAVAARRPMDPIEKVDPLKVLVVDDSNMNRKLLARLLSNQGHSCDQAEDGAVAVQKVKDIIATGGHYDAILCDYEMPVMDGPTAAKHIRALGCDSFIVGITGNLFPEDVSHFKSCGANLVLPKPLDMAVLMDAFIEHRVCTLTE